MKNVVCVLEKKDIETLEKALVIIQLLNTHTCAYVDLNVADGIISTVKELADEIEKVYEPKTTEEIINRYRGIEPDGEDKEEHDDDDDYPYDEREEEEPYAYCECCGEPIQYDDDVYYSADGRECCCDSCANELDEEYYDDEDEDYDE